VGALLAVLPQVLLACLYIIGQCFTVFFRDAVSRQIFRIDAEFSGPG
jgi:hypothetical protein